jgi:valine dehydrogenase (NAD+)
VTLVFERGTGHEQVVFYHDTQTGLRAVVGIYSTALGPALGGVRFVPYPSEEAALDDVLNLAKGMAYKNAVAGLPFGGGKAVIIGDPAVDKTERLLRSFGRLVRSLGGRYITACDVGTGVFDMDIMSLESRHVVGCSPANGGGGDPSGLTAFGVVWGMLACAEYVWGVRSLRRRRVGVLGVGKVGAPLVGRLLACGAEVVVADVRRKAVDRVLRAYPGVEVVGPVELAGVDLDIFAPCALGGALDEATVARLRARIVCGAANNQLAREGIDKDLADRGILYAPDYVVNAGGVIQVAEEFNDFSRTLAKRRVEKIYDTTKQVLALAADEGISPATAADRLAERLLAEAQPRLWSLS